MADNVESGQGNVPKQFETNSQPQSSNSNEVLPGKFGTICSFLLLIVGMIVAIVTRRYAPAYINLDSWENDCPNDYENACKANSAVLRVSFALTIFFTLQILGTMANTKLYDQLWIFKIMCFAALLIGFFFADSDIFDLRGYGWFARLSGFFFLILQQIILIDVAHSWNERWVSYSVDDEGERGQLWLVGILVISCILFAGSFSAIGVMFWQFQGCADNDVIISLTLVFPFVATILQIFVTEEGSLLTSGIMTAYATYVCYSAVSLNPDTDCNPTIDSSYQTLSTVIGLVLTILSLIWTTFNVVRRIPMITNKSTGNSVGILDIATGKKSKQDNSALENSNNTNENPYQSEGLKSLLVQVSMVFLLISGYFAMVLTNWVTLQESGSIDNPRTGRAAMWIQASGQWIAIIFYLWSLVAPILLPNRDFGG